MNEAKNEKENVVIKVQKYVKERDNLDEKLFFTTIMIAACTIGAVFEPSGISTTITILIRLGLGLSFGKFVTLLSEKVNMNEEMKKYLTDEVAKLEQMSEENSIEGKSR